MGFWEGGSGWGIHAHPWLIHVNVWQIPPQYCKVISLQLKKNKKNKKTNKTKNKKTDSYTESGCQEGKGAGENR